MCKIKALKHTIFSLCCLFGLQAAANPAPQAPPAVVVSIAPLADLVAGVMDGVTAPKLLLRGNGSPHHYHLKPSDASMLHQAQLIFWLGPELEAFLPRILANLPESNKNYALLELKTKLLFLESTALIKGKLSKTVKPGTTTQAIDPHVWLNPENASKLVQQVSEILSAFDPAHAHQYQSNRDKLQRQLQQLKQELQHRLEPLKAQSFLSHHAGYQYFTQAFGLKAIPSILAPHSHHASAKRLTEVDQYLQQASVNCIFIEPQLSKKMAVSIARRFELPLITIDALGSGNDRPEFAKYLQLLRGVADSMVDCGDDGRAP